MQTPTLQVWLGDGWRCQITGAHNSDQQYKIGKDKLYAVQFPLKGVQSILAQSWKNVFAVAVFLEERTYKSYKQFNISRAFSEFWLESETFSIQLYEDFLMEVLESSFFYKFSSSVKKWNIIIWFTFIEFC